MTDQIASAVTPDVRDRVKIFDTTLRDGEQSPGASMTLEEKIQIATLLDEMGVDIIEAGFPIASIGDFEAVTEIAKLIENATVCGLARSGKADIDRAFEALQHARKKRIHTFIATSDLHMEFKLQMTRDQVLNQIASSVSHARSLVDDVQWSPEDATRTDRDFLCLAVQTAIENGAGTINIPDTVGYTVPNESADIIRMLKARVRGIDGVTISTHCHNDLGLAVANALAAVDAGARQIECTINGLGERAGNAALEEVVMAMRVRNDIMPYRTGIDATRIMQASRLVSTVTGFPVQYNKAIVGKNAFAHEAGIHQHGMLADRRTYEIMNAEDVGQPATSLVLGKHSGKHAIAERARALGYELDQNALDAIFPAFKKLADEAREVTDHQLMELIGGNAAGRKAQPWKLRRVELRAAYGSRTEPFARIELDHEERGRVCDVGIGGGPLDAAFDAIQSIVGITASVQELDITHVADQDDGACLGYIELKVDGHIYSGRARGRDVIPTAVDAYVVAINQALSAGEAGRKGSQADAA
jgi:2-isopropylmalate synthase